MPWDLWRHVRDHFLTRAGAQSVLASGTWRWLFANLPYVAAADLLGRSFFDVLATFDALRSHVAA